MRSSSPDMVDRCVSVFLVGVEVEGRGGQGTRRQRRRVGGKSVATAVMSMRWSGVVMEGCKRVGQRQVQVQAGTQAVTGAGTGAGEGRNEPVSFSLDGHFKAVRHTTSRTVYNRLPSATIFRAPCPRTR